MPRTKPNDLTQVVGFRLPPPVIAELGRRARSAGFRSASAYLRYLAIQMAENKKAKTLLPVAE